MKTRKNWLPILAVICVILSLLAVPMSGLAGDASGKISASFAKEVHRVTDSGAKGNGTADDSAAIEKALNTAAGTSGGAVYFPKGTYRIGTSITVGRNTELIFEEGAQLSIDSGRSVKMLGNIVAGDYAIFTGSGSITGVPSTVVGNPCWFGAKGDGKTDDTAAFQKALNLFCQVDVPYRASGYVVSDLKMTKPNGFLQGADGKKVKLIAAAGTQNLISISVSYVQVGNLAFEMGKAPTATCIYFDNSKAILEQNRVFNIDANEAYTVIKDHGANMLITTAFENIRCIKGKGTAFVCNAMWGFMFVQDVVIDYSASSGTVNFPAMTVKNNAGMICKNVHIKGNAKGTAAAHGFVTENSEAMWWEDCVVENVTGTAFKHSGRPNSHHYFYKCSAVNSGAGGFVFENGSYVQMENCSVTGGKSDGIIADGSYLQLSNITVSGTKGSGIRSTARYTVFTNVETKNNAQYGVVSSGDGCVFVNLTGTGNASGLHSLSGAGTSVTTFS